MDNQITVEEEGDQITSFPDQTDSVDLLIPPKSSENVEKRKEQNFRVLLMMIFVGECLRLMLDIYFFLVVLHEKPHYSDQIWDVALCIAGLFPLCYSLSSYPGRSISLLMFTAISQVTPLGRFKHLIFGWIINNTDQGLPRVLKYAVVVILFVYYVAGIVVISLYLWFMFKQWRKRCMSIRTEMNPES